MSTRTAGARAGRPRRRPARKQGWYLPYLIILPAVIFELFIHVVPMLTGIWMSFKRLTKFFISNWAAAPNAGLDNFRKVLDMSSSTGQGFRSSLLVTCAFTVLVVGISWSLGMLAAVVLQRPFRGRAVVRTLFLIPYALPMYAGVIAWNFMFQKDTGAINHILVDNLGILDEGAFWLIGGNAFIALVVVAIWRWWPFAFLMLMAGLQSIPDDVYEAASLDGARRFRQWWSITLPMLRPVNLVLLLNMFLWTFNDFNTPYVLFGTSQPAAGDLISFHIYNASFLTWNFGAGSAMSVLLLLALLAVSGLYIAYLNRRSEDA